MTYLKGLSQTILLLQAIYQGYRVQAWVMVKKDVRVGVDRCSSRQDIILFGLSENLYDDDLDRSYRKTQHKDNFYEELEFNTFDNFVDDAHNMNYSYDTNFAGKSDLTESLLRLIPESNDNILFEACIGDDCDVEECKIPDSFKDSSDADSSVNVMLFLGISRAAPIESDARKVTRMERFDDWN